MNPDNQKLIDEIIDFWFAEAMRSAWFNSTAEIDNLILNNYQELWLRASKGELDGWAETAEGASALIILLDQMPLNMFRGQAQSFATEAKAIEIAKMCINKELDKQLTLMQRGFVYMPLMHSENVNDQALSVEQYSKLNAEGGSEDSLRFAKHHQSIVEKYGRFPHRNKILGRESTLEELEYLASKQAFTG